MPDFLILPGFLAFFSFSTQSVAWNYEIGFDPGCLILLVCLSDQLPVKMLRIYWVFRNAGLVLF